jgi:hypothetical protein
MNNRPPGNSTSTATSHTPGAIAALFDLFAIRVEDPITRIGLWALARLEQ